MSVKKGRVAVVTGGTRGIGAAISESLSHADYQVIATYVSNDEIAKSFSEKTGVHLSKFDVGDFDACQAAVDQIEKEYGPIDVLVNNAGIVRDAMFHKMDVAAWHDVISTNLSSCFNMCRSVINGMRTREFGRIVNIASVNGQKGQVGQVNYSAAKAGIIGFTKALAQENAAKGITVNTVAPGYIQTEMLSAIPAPVLDKILAMIPAGRLGTPDEVARAVVFLASDFAGYVTGTTFSLNGGQYLA